MGSGYGFSVGLMMVFPLLAIFAGSVGATDYMVGDASGWAQGSDYTTWAAGKSFVVGDNLVFKYTSRLHTVDEVGQTEYDSCTAGNSISSDSTGETTIALKEGTHYFICGVSGHCDGGMKLAVTVVAAASPGAGGGATTSPVSPTTPTISPPTTTSPGVASPRTGTSTQPSSTAALSPGVAALSALFAVVFKGLVL